MLAAFRSLWLASLVLVAAPVFAELPLENAPALTAAFSDLRIAPLLRFNGRDDHVRVADHPRLRPERFTLLATVRVAEIGAVQPILAKSQAAGNWCSYMLRIQADGRLSLAVENAAEERTIHWQTCRPVAAGRWQHLAASWCNAKGDATDARIYLDGEPQELEVVLNRGYGPNFRPGYSGEPLYLGRDQFPTGHFRGELRDLEICDRVLTAREVSAAARAALK